MVDNTAVSEQEASRNDYLTLVAPESLEEEQNFYDQPPFNSVFANISANNGLHVETVRRTTTAVLNSFGLEFLERLRDTTPAVSPEKLSLEIGRMLSVPGDVTKLMRATKMETGNRENLKRTVSEIDKRLKQYPLWYCYIATQLIGNGDYVANGERSLNKRKISAETPSYANWLSKQTQSRKNAVLWGINEVFPAEPDYHGHSRVRRMWTIKKAANLLPERK